jgi:hypothetical protein
MERRALDFEYLAFSFEQNWNAKKTPATLTSPQGTH